MLPHLEIVDSPQSKFFSMAVDFVRNPPGISGLYGQLFYLHSHFHAVGYYKYTVLNRYFSAEIVIDELWYRHVWQWDSNSHPPKMPLPEVREDVSPGMPVGWPCSAS